MIDRIITCQGTARKSLLSISYGSGVKLVLYNKRSVAAVLMIILLATMKYLYMSDFFPNLVIFELLLLIPSMLAMLWVAFLPSRYVSHRTEDTEKLDLDELKNDLYCRKCMTFKMEKPKHCADCDSCVIGWQHHCTLLGVCIDNNKYWPFGFLLCTWGVFALCTYWMLYSVSRQVIEMIAAQNSPQ